MGKPKIITSNVDIMAAADWSFRDNKPRWSGNKYASSATFDPFPAYRHRAEIVEEAVIKSERVCSPIWDVWLYIADREEEGRSNGYSSVSEPRHYEDGQWINDTPIGLIVLSGKRQPPHPAMTRYLVAHEYGHNVEYMLERVRGSKTLHSGEVVAEYAKLRGLHDDSLHHGSGGRWHDSATEIFACDFRILVCESEIEHWPHPGIPHPHHVEADLAAWWAQSLDEMSKYAPQTKVESE